MASQVLPIVYVIPSPNSQAPINTRIEAHFSKPLDQATIQPGLFFLLDSAGQRVEASVTYAENASASDYMLSLKPVSYTTTPPTWLAVNSSYAVILGGGIRAKDGSAQTVFSSWSFGTKNSADIIAPLFGGLLSATALDTSSVRLTWGPALDNPGGTPSGQLIFSICLSDFVNACTASYSETIPNPPASVDANGNYSFVVNPLRPDTPHYFMVRVEDLAGNRDQNNVQLSATTLPGKLYVSNFLKNEVLGFDHPTKFDAQTTARSIHASLNGITGPYATFFDVAANRLYVASCQVGPIANSPSATLLDATQGGPCSKNKISIYNNAATLPGGDQAPDLVIQSAVINGPMGLYVEHVTSLDTLYITNFVGGNVAIIKNVITGCPSSPCAPPATLISTGLTAPFGVAYDTVHNFLYVTNYVSAFSSPIIPGTTLLVFDGTQPLPPLIKTIDQFQFPAGLWLDGDTLYVANAGSIPGLGFPGIVAICNASLLQTGHQPANMICPSSPPAAAAQYLIGTQTSLLSPFGMATTSAISVSPALYVSDYADNSVKIYNPIPFFTTSGFNNTLHNVAPRYSIKGLGGEVDKPVGISAGTAGGFDYLMTVDPGRDFILFFDKVLQNYSAKCPPPDPCSFPADRIIAPTLSSPTGVYLNHAANSSGSIQDRLYAASYYNNAIAIMDGASTLKGDVTGSIYKIITSPALQNPYGIFVDTSQGREWVYALNGTPDGTGMNAVLVFNTTALTSCTTVICNIAPSRIIHSADFQNPAGIWVDEGSDPGQTAPRDILYVSSRGAKTYGSPGAILVFKNASTLDDTLGPILADKIIQGASPADDNTKLLTPAGLNFDPDRDDLYVADEARGLILVFNQPHNCVSVNRVCNIAPTRTIYNSQDLVTAFDSPSAVAIDFKTQQMYISTLGLFNFAPSLLLLNGAVTLNNDQIPFPYLSAINNASVVLDAPLAIFIDNLH